MTLEDIWNDIPPQTARWQELFADADTRLVEKFLAFHKKNPDVFELFRRFAEEARKSGRSRFSHWMIANRIRWYTAVETTGKHFKLSNDYLACYVRLLIYHYPQYEGMFTLHAMKPDRSWPKE